jgi:hypothetical protein
MNEINLNDIKDTWKCVSENYENIVKLTENYHELAETTIRQLIIRLGLDGIVETKGDDNKSYKGKLIVSRLCDLSTFPINVSFHTIKKNGDISKYGTYVCGGGLGAISCRVSLDKLTECLTKTFKPYVCKDDNNE